MESNEPPLPEDEAERLRDMIQQNKPEEGSIQTSSKRKRSLYIRAIFLLRLHFC